MSRPTYVHIRTDMADDHGDGLRIKPGGLVELVREDGSTENLLGVRHVTIHMDGGEIPRVFLEMRSNFKVDVVGEGEIQTYIPPGKPVASA